MPPTVDCYLQCFPIDGAIFQADSTTYTAKLEREPVLQGCRVNYFVRFTSLSGDVRRLVITFLTTDLLLDRCCSRWAMFLLRRWITVPPEELEQHASRAIDQVDGRCLGEFTVVLRPSSEFESSDQSQPAIQPRPTV